MGDGTDDIRMPLEGGDDVLFRQAKVAEHLAVAAMSLLGVAEPAAVPLEVKTVSEAPSRQTLLYYNSPFCFSPC